MQRQSMSTGSVSVTFRRNCRRDMTFWITTLDRGMHQVQMSGALHADASSLVTPKKRVSVRGIKV
jgi:hypothetical protein